MKKNLRKTIAQFLAMDLNQRNELFSRSHSEIPYIEARAKLFVSLPVEETVRLLSEVPPCIEVDHFLFEHVFELPNTTILVFNEIIPRLSPIRSVILMFQTGPFMFIKDMFNLLPSETAISIIDEGCLETSDHEGKTFEILYDRVGATREENLKPILQGIKPETFKVILEYGHLLEKERKLIIYQVSLMEDEKKIADICNAISIKNALLILTCIKDKQKQGDVLKLLPPKYKNAFFNKTSDEKGNTLKSSQVDVSKLGLKAKRNFFKKFPKSRQVDKLSISEKIEIFS